MRAAVNNIVGRLARLWPSEAPLRQREWVFAPADLPASGDKLRDAAVNGQEAQRLLENERLRWALGEIRAKLRDEMEKCPIRDADGLRVLRLWVEVAKAFEANLQSLITDGKMAEAELARIERQTEIERKYGRIVI